MSSEILLNRSCEGVHGRVKPSGANVVMQTRIYTCFALRPKTNSMASITFDFPLPLGPTTAEKDCERKL